MANIKTMDTHCHLQHKWFDDDRDEVIARAKKEMYFIIESGANAPWSRGAIKLSQKHKGFIYATAGLHPIDAQKMSKVDFEKELDWIRENKDKIVGVGEVGLDYHWEKDEKMQALQRERFSQFISLANEINKPLVIHSWDGEADAVDILSREVKVPVVMHCFSGKVDVLLRAIELGYYISFSTQILASKNHRRLVKNTPLEVMLLETDAPYLGPNREKNMPWNTLLAAEKIAGIKDVSVDEVVKVALGNAKNIFGI
ncbi:MAG: YchF/TatD family DNA exonuclease [Nanohaloarchaea archaeon]|nr:YchF/TatD family DNA exonuclease [Candidatus Nanohaloarchaea archaeon]